MLDVVIRGGTVIDGTGAPPRQADVGIRGDRIVAVGEVDESAHQVMTADDLMVAPGFVDPHTHYDAQLTWDGAATPSSQHGVTSVIGGNCGFSLAPLHERDGDYTRRMMAQVEGMPLAALEEGMDWGSRSFGEYLEGFEGRIAVNAGFLVGHCALRRYVMGEASLERAATEREVRELSAELHRSLEDGALGLSTTRSPTHPDHLGNPVPSRLAGTDELLELCGVVGQHAGTSLEAIVEGCLKYFTAEEIELLASMSATANRPLNWNVLSIDASQADRVTHQLRASDRAREIGGRVVALTMPVIADTNVSLGTYCSLWLIPGWREILTLPLEAKTAKLRDPLVRVQMEAAAKGTPFEHRARPTAYVIGETVAPENRVYDGRTVQEIAEERGVDPWDALIDIEAADEYQTVLWPVPTADSEEDWQTRRRFWSHPDVLLGGSDAGAHLDRLLGSPYPTRFLADTLRGRKLLPVEEAVRLMTDVPARLFGLRDRGRIAEGQFADLVVFDPSTVDGGAARRVYDFPGGSFRLTAPSTGVWSVVVNGTETLSDGELTGAMPGAVLRSGRETETVETRATPGGAGTRARG